MKRLTIEIDDDAHLVLVEQAKADDRPLVKYIKRLLEKQAGKSKPN